MKNNTFNIYKKRSKRFKSAYNKLRCVASNNF